MRISTLAAVALAAGFASATPALALNGAAVNHADVARVSAEVATIADPATRAQAEHKVWQASEWVIERNDHLAYDALQDALELAGPTQVTQQSN